MKILLVEDDKLLNEGVLLALNSEGYACDAVTTLEQMHLFLKESLYSLLILDIGLPDGSGIDALKTLRTSGFHMPVLIVTARDSLDDKVIGLDAGADDYLIKPFELKELFARVRALFRRSEGQSSNLIKYKQFSLDVSKRILLLNDSNIDLTMREFAIFHRLILRAGEVVLRQQLLNDMYAWSEEFGSNTLEVYIHNLRNKLGKNSIVTIRGQGYRLE